MVKDNISQRLKNLRLALKVFPQEVQEELIRLTPVDKGFARKNTKLINNRIIHADYPYAEVLDKGRHKTAKGMRGSRQAPKGMTKPLTAWARKRLDQIARGGKK